MWSCYPEHSEEGFKRGDMLGRGYPKPSEKFRMTRRTPDGVEEYKKFDHTYSRDS